MTLPTYSFDTNAFIDWWVRYYSPDILPSLKTNVEQVVSSGRLKASLSVYDELERGGDELFGWAKSLKSDIFEQDSPTIQAAAKILIKQYSSPTKPKWGLGGADPFVIAHAQTAAPKRIVVSGEKGDQNNPKIKYVCDQIGLTCVSFRSFWEMEGWKL